jgi:hypothetical protein
MILRFYIRSYFLYDVVDIFEGFGELFKKFPKIEYHFFIAFKDV